MESAPNPKRVALNYVRAAYHNTNVQKALGRTAAGNSFLHGFFKYVEADVIGISTANKRNIEDLLSFTRENRYNRKLQPCYFMNPQKIIPHQTEFLLDPLIGSLGSRRHGIGNHAYSICGITHTISTTSIKKGILNLRAEHIQEWDGIICASKAVQGAMKNLMDYHDQHFIERFGKAPPRPQTPVIPLGILTEKYQENKAAGRKLRKKLNCADNEIIITTLSRLDASNKFDPYPSFIAMQKAQERLGESRQLHFVACGWYTDEINKGIFENGAKALMPDVKFTHIDGGEHINVERALSAADIFLFPIDNIQESFGLAPVEAMAAGLPIIGTDWDGLRDTITPDVGIRIPTTTPYGRSSVIMDWANQQNLIAREVHHSATSSLVNFDLGQMAEAIFSLASNDDLRKKMSKAALKRAKSVYDWSVVIPQYQDFFSELNQIRTQLNGVKELNQTYKLESPATFDYLSDFPTKREESQTKNLRALDVSYDFDEFINIRNFKETTKNVNFISFEQTKTLLETIRSKGDKGLNLKDFQIEGANRIDIDNQARFLLKFGFIETVNDV